MDPINDARFYESLIKSPHQRSPEDIRNIYEQLRQLDMFANLYNGALKAICASARYERHPDHSILFREGQASTCWYILLSGSVLIAKNIYHPYGCFGKRNGMNNRRLHDCLCMQESEMIVIDYPPEPLSHQQQQQPSARTTVTTAQLMRRSLASLEADALAMPPPPVPPRPPRFPPTGRQIANPGRLHRTYMELPVDVPSTSLYPPTTENHKSQVYLNGLSGDEDTLVRVRRDLKSHSISSSSNGPLRRMRIQSTASSTTTDGEELGGEAVDSEDEDGSCPSHESFLDLRDSVRECLEKEPGERNSEDLAVLLDFMQHMSAFAPLPISIKRQLCLKMVFAVVNDAGTVVMHHNEKLDAWSVIVNGLVEVVKANGDRVEYKLGDSFGAEPVLTTQFHDGEMRTIVDDCEFVLVEHKDFCSIMSTLPEHIEKDRDGATGEVTAEHERRTLGSQCGAVIIKAKPDRLIQHLVEDRDNSLDPYYVDDFLLTYRVFIHDPTLIFEKLMMLFADSQYRDKVARLILLWVNNHYNDFETNANMTKLLERFEGALERDGMHSQQSLLNIACSVKARPRTVTLLRSNKDEPLNVTLVGGKECGVGVFISEVVPDSTAEKAGLKKGDELIELNGQAMKYVTVARAEELSKGCLSLTLLLKSNILGFKELQGRTDRDGGGKAKNKNLANAINNGQPRNSVPSIIPVKTPKTVKTNGHKSSMMDKLFTILKAPKEGEDVPDEARSLSTDLRSSKSNPDIASISQYYGPVRSECPEHVLKIYRSDQSFKFLAVYKENTAQNVVQLALQEFSMTSESSTEWSLCECTVTGDGVIKQSRLPPQLENLAERISLNSRYYLKNNNLSDPLVPDGLAPEIMKEAQAQLLMLNAQVVAAQLTLQDFSVFASIEPSEYIDNLFQLESRYGWPRLEEFERLFNREMWWVATEVCSEKVVQNRVKLVKKFIKIARHCREMRNFNSMFAIMSGLDKPAVRRLHTTWREVPGKYIRMLEDVQQLVDPSRNMSKYRQHFAEVSQDPPVVPIYPIIKKDLTFSHEGNPTYVDKLVNFEKLRLIARSVRSVTKMCSAPYEISSMAERSGATINDALLHMNTFEGGNVATMRKSSRATQTRKKIYEQALMVRKVKAYLDGLSVVDSEADLDQLSYQIEPQQPTAPRPKRAPSPTPSSLSSQSAGSASTDRRFMGAKFGVESPQAVQKMFALVSSSKVKGVPTPSPMSSPASSRGLQRNVPRVTSRQQSAPSVQRTPSLKNEPLDLNQETSSVTSFYGKGMSGRSSSLISVPFATSIHVLPPSQFSAHISDRSSYPSTSSACSPSASSTTSSVARSTRPPSSASSKSSSSSRGTVLGHRPIPHNFTSSPRGLPPRAPPMHTISEANLLSSSEQVSRV